MSCKHCDCHSEHGHLHEESEKKKAICLISGGVLLITALILNSKALYILAYLILGYDVILSAIRNFRHIFNESFLMTIATVGAFILGEFAEACAVMLFYQIGEFLSDYATDKSKKSIGELIDLRSDTATLLTENGFLSVASDSVKLGDTVRVAAGQKVPLDGVISKGTGYFDTKSLTGEGVPKKLGVGDTVLSGFVLCDSVIEITVTKEYSESTASKILELINDDKKANSEKFMTKFARIYTPLVVLSALLIAVIPIIFDGAYKVWLYRAILFLVVSCPCALVVSIPLSFFAGIGCASLKGILLKGSSALERAAKIKNFAFDKTGTLTDGLFAVREIKSNGYSEDELLKYAAHCEFFSHHPIARAIIDFYGKDIDESLILGYKEVSGKGVLATINSHTVKVGSADFIGTNFQEKSVVYISIDGNFAGSIAISDRIKNEAKSAVLRLEKLGIRPCILTGDNAENTIPIADELGIPYYSSLLPKDKVDCIGKLKNSGVTAFAGDGINDAPALSNADTGISIGSIGSDAAIEASDIVLTSGNLEKLPLLIKIARKTMLIVKENIVFSISVKVAVMILGALGLASIWLAVFADVGILIMAVLNALRAFLIKD